MRLTVLDTYWGDMTISEAGAISYGTPKKLSGAVQVGITHNATDSRVFESGASIYNKSNVSGGTITLQTHTLSESDRAKLLYGITAATDYEVGGDADSPARGAFGFAVMEEDVATSTTKYRCTWFYDCTFAPPDNTYATSDESGPKTDPDEYSISFGRRPSDRKYMRTSVVDSAAAMTTFFGTVEKAEA